jgi:hypothetical protein
MLNRIMRRSIRVAFVLLIAFAGLAFVFALGLRKIVKSCRSFFRTTAAASADATATAQRGS